MILRCSTSRPDQPNPIWDQTLHAQRGEYVSLLFTPHGHGSQIKMRWHQLRVTADRQSSVLSLWSRCQAQPSLGPWLSMGLTNNPLSLGSHSSPNPSLLGARLAHHADLCHIKLCNQSSTYSCIGHASCPQCDQRRSTLIIIIYILAGLPSTFVYQRRTFPLINALLPQRNRIMTSARTHARRDPSELHAGRNEGMGHPQL